MPLLLGFPVAKQLLKTKFDQKKQIACLSSLWIPDAVVPQISDFKLPKHDQWSLQATQQRDVADRRMQARGSQGSVNRPGVTIAHVPPESLLNINTKPVPAYDVYS